MALVALPDFLPYRERSRILAGHGSLCFLLANYAADARLWILDLLPNPAWNNVDLFAGI
jgi:hypothetical protein